MEDAQSTMPFPRSLLRRFIQMYESLPCLWDRNCWGYKDRKIKQAAMKKLTDLVEEQIPEITKVHIIKKIDTIRSCYRRERKKVKNGHPNGAPYRPRLWYYELLSFLNEGSMKAEVAHNTATVDEEESDGADDAEYEQEETMVYDHQNLHGGINPFTEIEMADSSHNRGGGGGGGGGGGSMSYEDGPRKRHIVEIEDEYDAIGINVAAKLRSMPANVRVIAEKLINDVMFQGQINGLTINSALVTKDPIRSE